MPKRIPLADVKFDVSIYPRAKWNTATINRYADAMESGSEFPPLVLEEETNRLIDGKHRFEAKKKTGAKEVEVEYHTIPDGMSVKFYAATLSARHGDRMSNADLKALAEEEFEHDPSLDPQTWGGHLGVSKSSVYRWVSHIINREKAGRANKAWRMSRLGWTQKEIAELLGVHQGQVSKDMQNSHLGKLHKDLGPEWNEHGVSEWSERADVPLNDAMQRWTAWMTSSVWTDSTSKPSPTTSGISEVATT